MVTRIEQFFYDRNEWVIIEDVPPGRMGVFAHTTPDNRRELYLIFCAPDDLHSTIFKAPIKHQTRPYDIDEILNTAIVDTMGVIRHGDRPYLFTIQPDESPHKEILKFTHQ